MSKFVRRWNCELCGGEVVYDDVAKTLSCKCGVFKCGFVNPAAFIRIGAT